MALDHIVQEEEDQAEVHQSPVEAEDNCCLAVGNLVREVGKVVSILQMEAFLQAQAVHYFEVDQVGKKGIEKAVLRHMLN
jgi:hypothetical protein